MSRTAQRGGATVELAVMSVAFITTLLFGIYFGEVGYMMLKVNEAAHSTMLDATQRRVHKLDLKAVQTNFSNAYKPFNDAKFGFRGAAKDADDAYQDLNGVGPNGARFANVFASAGDVKVECAATSTLPGSDPLSFAIPNLSSPTRAYFFNQVEAYLKNMYRDRGGLMCSASATASAMGFPTRYLEGEVLSKEALFQGKQIKLCGIGLAKNGKCNGQLAVLTGDWALDGEMGNNVNEDMLQTQNGGLLKGNKAYREIIRELYERNGDGGQVKGSKRTAAQNLMLYAGGFDPADVLKKDGKYNERRFFMSDSGEESNYVQDLAVAKKDTYYNTSGVDLDSTAENPKQKSKKKMRYAPCFLGLARAGCK